MPHGSGTLLWQIAGESTEDLEKLVFVHDLQLILAQKLPEMRIWNAQECVRGNVVILSRR